MAMTCANCGAKMEKNGHTSPGNTPEEECPECWFDTTRATPFLAPEDQEQNLSLGEARKRWGSGA